jgi:hypothetical protein
MGSFWRGGSSVGSWCCLCADGAWREDRVLGQAVLSAPVGVSGLVFGCVLPVRICGDHAPERWTASALVSQTLAGAVAVSDGGDGLSLAEPGTSGKQLVESLGSQRLAGL